MEEDGFTLVQNKRRGKRNSRISKSSNTSIKIETEGDFETSLQKIIFFKKSLASNGEIEDFLEKIQREYVDHDESFQTQSNLVCYGLGKISSCQIALIQFSFLLLLRDFICTKVEAYDPSFSQTDKKLLKEFDVQVITQNENAKRSVTKGKVVFYMPHCDLFLYNNLLWANWSPERLRNIMIIGNSFKRIVGDQVSSKLKRKYHYILLAEKFNREYNFPLLKNYKNIFNNTSLIYFPNCNDQFQVSGNHILNSGEPSYSDEEFN